MDLKKIGIIGIILVILAFLLVLSQPLIMTSLPANFQDKQTIKGDSLEEEIGGYFAATPEPTAQSDTGSGSLNDQALKTNVGRNQDATESKEYIEQKIIKSADVRLEVQNVTESAAQVKEISDKHSGLIQASSINSLTTGHYYGSITIRVPASKFEIVMGDISTLGRVLSSSVNAEDVTEEYVDIEAKKNALSRQLAQYYKLLEKAVNVTEILDVQKEIERVQVELDRITGRMRYLDSRIAYSTISISLSEPAQVVTPAGYSIVSVVSEGIEGFVSTLIWLFVTLFTLLPLLILSGLGYWIWSKRRKVDEKAE